MKPTAITLEFDELDLISEIVARDRDQRLGGDGQTRLISDEEARRMPLHQAILKKLEEACVYKGAETFGIIELSGNAPLEIFPFVTSLHREVIIRHKDGTSEDIELTPAEADMIADRLRTAAAAASVMTVNQNDELGQRLDEAAAALAEEAAPSRPPFIVEVPAVLTRIVEQLKKDE